MNEVVVKFNSLSFISAIQDHQTNVLRTTLLATDVQHPIEGCFFLLHVIFLLYFSNMQRCLLELF